MLKCYLLSKIDNKKPKYYVLDMFPYPSGSGLHVGHPLGYIASDIYSRYKKLKGYKSYYRIKIGDYRIGVEIENDVIDFILISHRKNIYNLFP